MVSKIREFSFSDILWLLLLSIVWHLAFLLAGMYKSQRIMPTRIFVKNLLVTITVCSIATFFLGKLLHRKEIFLEFLVAFWLTTGVILVIFRLFLRMILTFFRMNHRNLRFILIAGCNERSLKFARSISQKPQLGYRILGFADDREWDNIREDGFEVICDLESVFDYLRHHVVDEIYLALPVNSFYRYSSRLVAACEEQGIVIRYPQVPFNANTAKNCQIVPGPLGDIQSTVHHRNGFREWEMSIKRILDIIFSTLMLVVFSPLMLIVAIIIIGIAAHDIYVLMTTRTLP